MNILYLLKEKIRRMIHLLNDFTRVYENKAEIQPLTSDTIKLFIRKINLGIVMGELDITPKLNRLDKETITQCRELSNRGWSIGGSVLLKASGLINRPHDDIDIFGDVEKSIKKGIIHKDNIINKSKDYEDSLLRYKILDPTHGELDIFQLKDSDVSDSIQVVDGIRFHDTLKTLEVKLGYGRQKDIRDYHYMKNKLNI